MTAADWLVLVVLLWMVIHPRPRAPRHRPVHMSDRWRLDHLYTDGKH